MLKGSPIGVPVPHGKLGKAIQPLVHTLAMLLARSLYPDRLEVIDYAKQNMEGSHLYRWIESPITTPSLL